MTPIERLQTALNGLGLKAVEARIESLLEQASKKEPSYADFLDELLSCEVDARRSRYLRARLQLAHLPFVKTFDQFDFSFQPSIDERQIRELRTLRFIHEASNVVFLGPPGVGKTHLSVALAEAAIQAGFGAYFMTKGGESYTSPEILQNGPRRQGSTSSRKTSTTLTAAGR